MNKRISVAPRALVVGALAGCLSLAAPRDADAQLLPTASGNGFDLHLFRPAVDTKGLFSVNGTDILGANSFSFGFVFDGGFGLARFGRDRTSGANAALVSSMFSGTASANYGIRDFLEIGLQLPFHIVGGPGTGDQRVDVSDRTVLGYEPGLQGANFQGIGDITLHAKFRWLRSEYYPVGLAIIVQGGWGPMHGPQGFAGEPGGFLWPSAALEWRQSRRFRIDANLGARLPFGAFTGGSAITRVADSNGAGAESITYGPSITWGIGASFRAVSVLDLVLETYGLNYVGGNAPIPLSMPWEWAAGAKIFIERNSYLMIGAGTRLLGGFAAADARAFIGIHFEPTVGDTDGDGYRDDVDQCPNDPEDFDNFQDDDGCSDPDNDRDGIPDAQDQCPLVPEDRDGDADGDGCPEGQIADRDGDGIADNVDQCPDDPEDRDGFEDADGCPDPDNDRDNIPDTIDNCPNDAEDFDNFEDDDGCPDPDNDRDGIPDTRDSCPNEPEVMNGVDDEDGCPDSGDLVILGNVISLREQIQFETDSAAIREVSFPILEQMANLLRRNPQFELVEVEGHTDRRSDDEHNLRLSLDRANSVRQGLVDRGIAADRLVAAGYGELCPVDPADNAAAWARNRRVQFVIVRSHDAGRTTAAAGCRRGAALIPASVGPPGTGVAREQSTPAGTTPVPPARTAPPATPAP